VELIPRAFKGDNETQTLQAERGNVCKSN